MKLHREDIRAFEILDLPEDSEGRFFVHLMRRRGPDLGEALGRVAERAGVAPRLLALSHPGEGASFVEQYLSVPGRRIGMSEPDLEVCFVGRSAHPLGKGSSRGMRFEVRVRDLSRAELVRLRRNRPSVRSQGIPNYFDAWERSTGAGDLPFLSILLGRFEKALEKALSRTGKRTDPGWRGLLERRWRDWRFLRDRAPEAWILPVLEHLIRAPKGFKGALDRMPASWKRGEVHAFQAAVWNRALSRFLGMRTRERERVRLPSPDGPLLCWRYLDERAHELFPGKELALVSSGRGITDPAFGKACAWVLGRWGLSWKDLDPPGLTGFRPEPELRPLWLRPEGFEFGDPEPEDRGRQRFELRLSFLLPRAGSPALVVRRLFAPPVHVRQVLWDRRRPRNPGRPRKRARRGGALPGKGIP